MNTHWHEVTRSLRRMAQPTADITLLDQHLRVTSEARTAKGDRDYPMLRAMALGRRCVLDVGANMGLTAMIMAGAMEPDGALIAFEASEHACTLIRRNVQLNGLESRIQVVNAVLAERSGLLIDFYWDNASGGASIIPGYLNHRQPIRKVTLALDDFVEQTGLKPDLIKIDVEGAEGRVLDGLRRTMEWLRPLIVAELHSWEGTSLSQNAAAILTGLPLIDYEMVYLRTREIVRDAAVLTGRGRCHVVLRPIGVDLPEALGTVDTGVL